MRPIRRILVPVDLTGVCGTAVEAAADLAVRFQAELVLLHAYEPPAYVYPTVTVDALPVTLEAVEESATAGVESLVARVRERHLDIQVRGVTERGFPRECILDAVARLECDLIVMATHGRHGLARAVLGSVAEVIVRLAPVPVLTLHPAPRAA